MPTTLSKPSVERAIDHLVRHGDTDILPLMVENVFLYEARAEIANELAQLDLNSFSPLQAIEVIAPKSRYGFRIVHQLPVLETILFTATMIELGAELEQAKRPIGEFGPFAYRFDVLAQPSLFSENHAYKDWLQWQRQYIRDGRFSEVIFTDIADFYQRIYLHRLDNILDLATAKKGLKAFVIKLIKQVRSRQSHGIPVGGSAARILAEVALCDTDSALAGEGYEFTRYMDDYRLFLTFDQQPYQVLAFLAEQLATSDGLSLNAQKTKLMPIDEYKTYLDSQLADVYDAAQNAALAALAHALFPTKNLTSEN